MAGVRTVEELLKIKPDHYDITIFGGEPHPNYNRILLSPVLAGEMTIQEIVLNELDWYREKGITLHTGRNISKIDRVKRKVIADDGSEAYYDRLLIATGSNPFILPIPGNDLPGAKAHFKWPNGKMRTLRVAWGAYWATTRAKDGAVDISMYETDKADEALASKIGPPPAPRAEVCEVIRRAGALADCREVPIFDNPACFETYRNDASSTYECLLGEIEPVCPRGTGPVGSFQRCLPLCAKEAPCATGTCTPYAGAEVCL